MKIAVAVKMEEPLTKKLAFFLILYATDNRKKNDPLCSIDTHGYCFLRADSLIFSSG